MPRVAGRPSAVRGGVVELALPLLPPHPVATKRDAGTTAAAARMMERGLLCMPPSVPRGGPAVVARRATLRSLRLPPAQYDDVPPEANRDHLGPSGMIGAHAPGHRQPRPP